MISSAELDQLDEDTLKKLLKKVRAEKAAAASTPIPPLPPYEKGPDSADLLDFDYGLELAFRPDAGMPYFKDIKTEKLVPFLYVKRRVDKSVGRGYLRKSPAVEMFAEALKNFSAHIGARIGCEDVTGANSDIEIEFPSPIMDRLSQIEWYYTRIRNLADSLGASVDKADTNSGGGHIHVTKKKNVAELDTRWSEVEKYAVALAVCEQPWLTWVFNDPDDNSTAVNPVMQFVRAACDCDGERDWWDYVDIDCTSTAVRTNAPAAITTLEFRLFQAPHNVEEQKRHVLFLDRWLKHTLRKAPKKIPKDMPRLKYMFRQDMRRIEFEYACEAFYNKVYEIGLNPFDYTVFVERNMRVRYENKWIRN